MVTAARTITTGLVLGTVFGVSQDAMIWARMKYGVDQDEKESWIYRNARNKAKVEVVGDMEQK
jgi:hypothetical protein